MKKLFTILLMLLAMNANAQWVQMSNGMPTDRRIFSLAAKDSLIFAGTNAYGIYISSNNGLSWSQSSLGNKGVNAITVVGNDIFAGTSYNGVYISNNNGANWSQTSLNASTVYSLASNQFYVFAGYDSGVCRTTDKGGTWTYSVMPSTRSFLVNGNYVFAGTMGGVSVSTNYGQSFSYGTMSYNFILSLAYHNNYLYAGTAYYGIYKSTDNGLNWTVTALDTVTNYSFANYYNNLFTGCGSGVYLTTNNGVNWVQKNEGMTGNYWVSSLLISNGFIYAGTPYQGLWRRPLSNFTSIKEITGVVSESYSLKQNYPNPFNPITNVQFSMCNAGNVKLVVYDIQGREVQTLVNERLQPGSYKASFDGSKLNSGVYFYKLVTDGFTETKKMLMIK